MMKKASGLIALLLIAAIMLLPAKCPPFNDIATETPLSVSGVSAPHSDSAPQDDEIDNSKKIVAIVIIVVVVIFIIYCITGAETNHAVRR